MLPEFIIYKYKAGQVVGGRRNGHYFLLSCPKESLLLSTPISSFQNINPKSGELSPCPSIIISTRLREVGVFLAQGQLRLSSVVSVFGNIIKGSRVKKINDF